MKSNFKNTFQHNFLLCLFMLFSLIYTQELLAQDPLVITQDGNVGIGTDIPNRNLTIYGEDKAYLNTKTKTGYEFLIGVDAGGGIISTMSNHDLQLRAGGNSVKMIIKSSGKIGIGITDPGTYLLNVNGAFKASSANFTNNAYASNSVIGDVGHGAIWAGFAHKSVEGQNNYALLQKNDGLYTLINKKSGDGWIGFRVNNADKMVVHNNGNVGIGITKPIQAKLVVQSSVNYSLGKTPQILNGIYYTKDINEKFTPVSRRSINSNTQKVMNLYAWVANKSEVNTFGGSYKASIYASEDILAKGFIAYSDARIKNVLGLSDSRDDLALIKEIEITNYQMKDVIARGQRPYKKVIAQQVKKVYPQAISYSTDVIPDIYQMATIKKGWVNITTDLKKGEQVQLIFGNEKMLFEVLENEKNRFQILTDREGDVFVFGRQVDDFHSVDYEAISMLNVSATQELAKQMEALQSKNEALEVQIALLQKQVKNIDTLKASIAELQSMMQKNLETVSDTRSMKK